MERLRNSRWFSLLIVLTAPFLSLMDIFIINIAIPAIKKGLHSSNAELQIVIAGYLLGYASFLITGPLTRVRNVSLKITVFREF